ncbi:hypothetical protein AOLI_G00297780 [Acnodon oligacanthus]
MLEECGITSPGDALHQRDWSSLQYIQQYIARPEAVPETPVHFTTRDECCTDDHKPPHKMASDLTAVPDALESTAQLEALEVRHQSREWTTANIPR